MAEEQSVEEQEKDSQAQQEGSTIGRLKSRVRDLVGTDSEEANKESDGEERPSAEADSDDAEAEGSDEESASGEQDAERASGEGEGSEDEGGVSTDDVDLSTVADDEETARAQIDKMVEEGPPEDLGDWPTGKAMYLSFGGAEGEEGYEDGPARQMGPSSLRHHADGSVEVQGEKVDNPEDYKAEQSVGEEAENLGLDKGAKSEGDEGEGSSSEEGSSSDQDPQAESSGDARAEGGDSESDGSDSDDSESQQTESETAEAS